MYVKREMTYHVLIWLFQENLGTGKTTVAKLVGRILSELKILGHNAPFVETSREQLIGKFIGHTEEKVLETVNNAIGGVLFIDEAYSLVNCDSNNDFGYQAINVLVNQLDIHKNDLCVIFAGYKNEMIDFLKSNAGLASRIPFKIEFNNYNENELFDILNQFISNTDFKFEEGCKELLLEHFKIMKTRKNFGNGRYVRNFFERLKIKQANRIMNENGDINLITIKDINNTIDSIKMIHKEEVKIGFQPL